MRFVIPLTAVVGWFVTASSAAAFNKTGLLDLHKLLIETESVSGNEHAAGMLLASVLRANNFTVELQSVPSSKSEPNVRAAERYNVLAYRGDVREASRVLLTSHIDTVPPFYGYELRNETDIWGRGSCDAKASVAAQITSLLSLLDDRAVRDSDVALLYVVGEEVNGDGMTAANDLNLSFDAVIFGEPTELKLAAGHKGAILVNITAHGKAGHSGYPWLGESANSMLLPALVKLEQMQLPWSEKYGNTTLNIGRLEGGVAANVIAEKAFATIQIRLAAGSPKELERKVREAIREVDERLELEFWLGYGPVPCDTDIDGFDTITVNYGTDVPHLKGDHKRYLYGPGTILVAHSDHEHIQADDLIEAVSGYQKLILGALERNVEKTQPSEL